MVGASKAALANAIFIYQLNFIRRSLVVNESKTWVCLVCGWFYDEEAGAPDHGIAAGTAWSAVPASWTCPECGAGKDAFEMVQI